MLGVIHGWLQLADAVDSNRKLPCRAMFKGIRYVDMVMTVLCKNAGLVMLDQYSFHVDDETDIIDGNGKS